MMLSGLRVLLAEDNPTNQLVAAQMLESLGASVLLAADGVEALEIVAREPFDVMLVDIEMPRVSGIEVIRTVRESSGPIAEVPMIALTAYVMREHRAAIAAAGADGVIAKPILSIEQFGADIRRFMRRRTDAAEAAEAASGVTRLANGVAPSVIDRNIYDTLAEAIGPAAMSELLGKVDSDMKAARARLARALDPIDLGEVRSVTHIMISVAGAVGALPVQEGARRMNAAGHRDDAAAIERDMQELLGEIDRMLEHLGEPNHG
ncbi:MAG: response regulator [Proteobacteria bacterium]|nr:response regulator [Pseudomonadota bacterium]